jgi:acetoin utilization deacetylase AcuC-like enzyme
LPGYYCYGVGTPVLEHTWEAAYWSAQVALTAADRILAGDRVAYALCRPPGHHAAADLCGGLCYLNNAAIAAHYLQHISRDKERRPGVRTESRIAILDIDYHHGNGTQEIFYTDPTVLYCSLHAHPDDDYPYYWGTADEVGEGDGVGYNRNWPLRKHTGDDTYLVALDESLAIIRGFTPRWLVVSVGFDTVAGDPIGEFDLSENGLVEIGQRIAHLGLPTLIVQEGGYLLERLGEIAVSFLKAFIS